jgi:hypothetical protein
MVAGHFKTGYADADYHLEISTSTRALRIKMLSGDTQKKTDEIGLLDLLVVIAESWIAIVLVSLLATGGAYLTMHDAGTYTASASLPVESNRVQPVLGEAFPDVVVLGTDSSTLISTTGSTIVEARQRLEGAIKLLAAAPFLSETDTAAEIVAVGVWSEEANLLRQSLSRVEAGYEASVAVDPGSYASAVTLLMSELAARERKLRNSDIRLSQKVVSKPEAVLVSISANSAVNIRALLVVGFVAGLLAVLVVLFRNALYRLDTDAQSKFTRIRRAFFIPTRTEKK